MGKVGEEISKIRRGGKERIVGETMQHRNGNKELDKTASFGSFVEMVPSDTAVILFVDDLHLKFLESVPGQMEIQGPPLVQFLGSGLNIKVTHRILGGAMVISSVLCWQSIQVDCIETELDTSLEYLEQNSGFKFHPDQKGADSLPQMRAVLWIDGHRDNLMSNGHSHQNVLSHHVPFLDVNIVHVLPYKVQDAECHSLNVTAKVAGVRLGGGMNYNEALLHRFGILGPDGGPGEGLKNGLSNLSRGPLAKLLKPSPQVSGARMESNDPLLEITSPDDIQIDIKLQDWCFALEGAECITQDPVSQLSSSFSIPREQRCWHMAFQSVCVSAKSGKKCSYNQSSEKERPNKKHPVEVITVSVEGLQVLKPETVNYNTQLDPSTNGLMQDHGRRLKSAVTCNSGVDLEVRMVISENDIDIGMGEWVVHSIRGAVKEPVDIEATKGELDYLVLLSKSEVESLSRITAGILQVLQLQGSLGQATIDQLSNIGSGSLDGVITPDRFRQRSSIGSVSCMPSNSNVERSGKNLDSTISMLEQSISECQDICTTLSRKLLRHPSEAEYFAENDHRLSAETCTTNFEDLTKHLEKMQTLLSKLRNEV